VTASLGHALNARRRRTVGAAGGPDFTLSNSTVTTEWGTVEVGTLTPVDAPAGVYFLIVEDTNPTGEYAGIAVVNG
jgi:hypothetical protein